MNHPPHIIRTELEGRVVLAPVGEFDISSVDMLRATFVEATSETTNQVVLDLSGTTFLDSMALGTMLGVSRRVTAWGGWVRVVAPRPNVRKVLRLTGLDKVFALYDTVDQALTHQVTSQVRADAASQEKSTASA
ncbi:anti-anti-sigma factor [Marmoricola sp. OAE513]|uniref:STAS domain-containing protein n=1 Tax=Marmoricola sp. OAE513 TaxID=2817894 RepID=UPI001AE4CDA2